MDVDVSRWVREAEADFLARQERSRRNAPLTRPYVIDVERHIATLIEYAKAAFERRDWHAVRDACVDIEVLEAARGR